MRDPLKCSYFINLEKIVEEVLDLVKEMVFTKLQILSLDQGLILKKKDKILLNLIIQQLTVHSVGHKEML